MMFILTRSLGLWVRLTWFANAYSRPLFQTVKWITMTWFLACDQGSLVGLCVQDYKSLCAAITICSTVINIKRHTHTQHFDQLIWKALPAERKIKIFISLLLKQPSSYNRVNAINSQIISRVCLLDLSTAFNTFDHKILVTPETLTSRPGLCLQTTLWRSCLGLGLLLLALRGGLPWDWFDILTPSAPAASNCCCSKGRALYWSNPLLLIFGIWALWHSVLSTRAPECQKL